MPDRDSGWPEDEDAYEGDAPTTATYDENGVYNWSERRRPTGAYFVRPESRVRRILKKIVRA